MQIHSHQSPNLADTHTDVPKHQLIKSLLINLKKKKKEEKVKKKKGKHGMWENISMDL